MLSDRMIFDRLSTPNLQSARELKLGNLGRYAGRWAVADSDEARAWYASCMKEKAQEISLIESILKTRGVSLSAAKES